MLIDHGLYIDVPEKFRKEYAQLWRSIFVGDIAVVEVRSCSPTSVWAKNASSGQRSYGGSTPGAATSLPARSCCGHIG